jgi:hypothetical protein
MPTYPLSFPAVTPNSERLAVNRRQAAIASNFSLVQQTINTASQWTLTWTWPPMRQNVAERLRAWLNSLRGQVGYFRYYPRQTVTSTLTGRKVAETAYAYLSAVAMGGWVAGQASQLRIGQLFSIGSQLFEVTDAPANADSNGQCLVQFEPALRQTYAVDTDVEFFRPSGLFRLNSSEGQTYTLTPGGQRGNLAEFGTLTAVEAVGA